MLLWGLPNPEYFFFDFYKERWADHLYAWNLSTARLQVKKAGFDAVFVFLGFPRIWSLLLLRIVSLIPFTI